MCELTVRLTFCIYICRICFLGDIFLIDLYLLIQGCQVFGGGIIFFHIFSVGRAHFIIYGNASDKFVRLAGTGRSHYPIHIFKGINVLCLLFNFVCNVNDQVKIEIGSHLNNL